MNKYCFACIIFLLCPLLLISCGKKRWPTANVVKEKFYWDSINSTRQGKCLQIRASVKGNIQNLKKIVLLLQESKNICTDCPFQATEIVPVYTAPAKYNAQTSFRFDYCKLEKKQYYRFRLKGINRFDSVQAAKTKVYQF